MKPRADLPYRPAAGVMLLNAAGKVFVGQRLDSRADAWQMPQGGIDPGEDAEDCAYRELEEETGIARHLVELIARAPRELDYELPEALAGRLWGGRYRGQRQSWFLMRFLGTDADVRLETKHPEFGAFRWVDPHELPGMIVAFKADLYRAVLSAFAAHLPAPPPA